VQIVHFGDIGRFVKRFLLAAARISGRGGPACGYAASFVTGSVPDLSINPALTGLVETRMVSESADEQRWNRFS
jgi:hypothetical protein